MSKESAGKENTIVGKESTDKEKNIDDMSEFSNVDNEEFDRLVKAVADISTPMKWNMEPPMKTSVMKAKIRRTRQMAFIQAFSACGILGEACKAAGINRATELGWRNSNDAWYTAQFKNAVEEFREKTFAKIRDWAFEGIEIPVFGKVATPFGPEDQLIGHKRLHSENLLMFLAKKVDPTFKERYEPPKEISAEPESVSPLTRITIHIDNIEARKNAQITGSIKKELPENSDIIDVNPIESTDSAADQDSIPVPRPATD